MIKLKCIFEEKDLRKWSGLTWLKIRRGGGFFLCKAVMRLWVAKTAGNSLKAEELFVSAA